MSMASLCKALEEKCVVNLTNFIDMDDSKEFWSEVKNVKQSKKTKKGRFFSEFAFSLCVVVQENSFTLIESSELELLRSEVRIFKARTKQLQEINEDQKKLIKSLNESLAEKDIKDCVESMYGESTQQFDNQWSKIAGMVDDENDDDVGTYVDPDGRVRKKRRKNWN